MIGCALAAVCAMGLASIPDSEPVITGIAAQPIVWGANLITNGGFEEPAPSSPAAGWLWDRRNTDATCEPDERVARSGKRSLRITNGTPFGAHGMRLCEWCSGAIGRQTTGAMHLHSHIVD
ncbi:MAG: hypothetical protein GX446_00435 [Chthonomonadales bacterium]|nr:hypothetical protein [Chthonomonadales bacterium]